MYVNVPVLGVAKPYPKPNHRLPPQCPARKLQQGQQLQCATMDKVGCRTCMETYTDTEVY